MRHVFVKGLSKRDQRAEISETIFLNEKFWGKKATPIEAT
jgi:hypothetical protein